VREFVTHIQEARQRDGETYSWSYLPPRFIQYIEWRGREGNTRSVVHLIEFPNLISIVMRLCWLGRGNRVKFDIDQTDLEISARAVVNSRDASNECILRL
jgi:hypothetical protein